MPLAKPSPNRSLPTKADPIRCLRSAQRFAGGNSLRRYEQNPLLACLTLVWRSQQQCPLAPSTDAPPPSSLFFNLFFSNQVFIVDRHWHCVYSDNATRLFKQHPITRRRAPHALNCAVRHTLSSTLQNSGPCIVERTFDSEGNTLHIPPSDVIPAIAADFDPALI